MPGEHLNFLAAALLSNPSAQAKMTRARRASSE
jgi:hypothetical protein